MKKKKAIQKELEGLNSILSKQEVKDNFEIPKDYFENFQKDVFNKLELENKKPEVKTTNAKTRKLNFRVALPIAASLALLLGLFYFSQPTDQADTLALDQLSTEDIELYIEENIDDFDIELLSMLDMDETDMLIPGDAEIQDYLEENIDDLDQSLFDELF